jgi:MinD-like ATPase involved in chromosome partitioning or flagellar assembly
MYVVTFYSFKGGTGRSMALANVAAELANRGKRVLMVDFDLEAPGLDTFPFRRPEKQQPGLVEFIHSYLATGNAPDVKEFVYETCALSHQQSCIWMMPAGRQDETYDNRFRAIDWNDLYENEDGFVLFEDLKAQWKQAFQPDYVLIDSRTGHTDTGGICTRQLPDAVVALFLPNEQNRRGLKPIIESIRAESRGPLKKSIYLHFVMANVPDLQDEEDILAEQAELFEKALNYGELSATIHHYNSLAMLHQDLFVLDRPKSSLAREYRKLMDAIVRQNVEDTQGAVMFLEETMRDFRFARETVALKALESHLQLIKGYHPNNPDVIRRLALIRRSQRRNDEALMLLDGIVNAGIVDSEILLARAELLAEQGKSDLALAELSRLFALEDAPDIDVSLAVRLQMQLDKAGAKQLVNSPLLASIDSDGLVDIARELDSTIETLPVNEALLRRWLELHGRDSNAEEVDDVRLEFVLCLIGLGKFKEAMATISPDSPKPEVLGQHEAFNYAMAEWGYSSSPPQGLLNRVIALHEQKEEDLFDANYMQCIAITYSLIGKADLAIETADRAANAARRAPGLTFSAWSYMMVKSRQFREEIEELQRMLHGEPLLPEFIRRSKGRTASLFD